MGTGKSKYQYTNAQKRIYEEYSSLSDAKLESMIANKEEYYTNVILIIEDILEARKKNPFQRRKTDKPKKQTSYYNPKNINTENWWRAQTILPSFSNRRVIFVLAIIILILIAIFTPSDPDYDEYIETKAKIKMLKEEGLATDQDEKEFDRIYREAQKEKKENK
jgi:hypothetical protein